MTDVKVDGNQIHIDGELAKRLMTFASKLEKPVEAIVNEAIMAHFDQFYDVDGNLKKCAKL